MKEKITKKQILYLSLLTLAVATPFLPWYYKLDLHLKFKYVIIPGICLIIALLAIIGLIDSVRDSEKNNHKKITKVNNFQKISVDDRILLSHRLRCLSPCCFECLLEKIFEFKGYEIVKSPSYLGDKPQADNGYDLIVKKGDENIYVQIKKNIANYIKDKQIKEFKGTILKNKGIYITTSVYSSNAKRYASKVGIRLVDYNDLLDIIGTLSDKEKQGIQEFVNNETHLGDSKYSPKTCKNCGAPMKKGDRGYYCLNRYESMKCCNKEYIG